MIPRRRYPPPILEGRQEPKCGAAGAVLNLSTLLLGSGVLALPWAAATMGWSVLLAIVGASLAEAYSLSLLVACVDALDDEVDGVDAASAAFGVPGRLAFIGGVIVEFVGMAAADLVLFGLSVPRDWGGIIGAALCALAVCACEARSVAYASMGSILVVLAAIGVLATDDRASSSFVFFDCATPAVGVVFFCVSGCQAVFPSILHGMRERCATRVVVASTSFAAFTQAGVAVAGLVAAPWRPNFTLDLDCVAGRVVTAAVSANLIVVVCVLCLAIVDAVDEALVVLYAVASGRRRIRRRSSIRTHGDSPPLVPPPDAPDDDSPTTWSETARKALFERWNSAAHVATRPPLSPGPNVTLLDWQSRLKISYYSAAKDQYGAVGDDEESMSTVRELGESHAGPLPRSCLTMGVVLVVTSLALCFRRDFATLAALTGGCVTSTTTLLFPLACHVRLCGWPATVKGRAAHYAIVLLALVTMLLVTLPFLCRLFPSSSSSR